MPLGHGHNSAGPEGDRPLERHASHPSHRAPMVSLVIPALNEASGLAEILPRVPERVDEIIVVDGGSSDGTPETILRERPDAVLVRQEGRGKGSALKQGLELSRGDILITMDADGSMNPEDIVAFVDELEHGADFVKGSRSITGAGSDDFTRLRSAGNTGLTHLANVIFGSKYTDITFGFNGYWRSTMEHLGEMADGFQFEIQAALRASALGLNTTEVPTHEPARIGGRSKLSPMRDGWAILKIIMVEAADRPAPLASDLTVRRFRPGIATPTEVTRRRVDGTRTLSDPAPGPPQRVAIADAHPGTASLASSCLESYLTIGSRRVRAPVQADDHRLTARPLDRD